MHARNTRKDPVSMYLTVELRNVSSDREFSTFFPLFHRSPPGFIRCSLCISQLWISHHTCVRSLSFNLSATAALNLSTTLISLRPPSSGGKRFLSPRPPAFVFFLLSFLHLLVLALNICLLLQRESNQGFFFHPLRLFCLCRY